MKQIVRVGSLLFLCLGLLGGSVVPARAATRHELGIATSTSLLWMDEERVQQRLRDIKALGATWIRVDFSWAEIQPDNPRQYKWGPFDRIVKEADRHGLKILAVLAYTPKWAREPRCAKVVSDEVEGRKCNPRNNNEFGRFARASALRYKGKNIRAWEIWNEPNIRGYWHSFRTDGTVFVDPVKYAHLANTAARQVRQNYPDSLIITGGLSPMFEPKYPKGIRQSDFLAQMLKILKPHLFDGVGIHPYSWPVLPDKPAPYNAFYTVDNGQPDHNLRAVMKKAGWGKKEIWATEFGATTSGVRMVANPTAELRSDHVTESVQAQIISRGVQKWYAKTNVGPLFVHSDTDEWLQQHKNEGGFGLRRRDGSKKPAYHALQDSAKSLN